MNLGRASLSNPNYSTAPNLKARRLLCGAQSAAKQKHESSPGDITPGGAAASVALEHRLLATRATI